MHRAVILAIAVALLAGCGATRPAPTHHRSQTERMKAVVRAWSRDLNTGDYRAEASLFRLPVTMVQGAYQYLLTTPKEVAEWHAALPCAGKIVSITVRGRVATGVFRLADRKDSQCNAPGELAAARFTIESGKIVHWEQVPPPSAAAPVA